jgi:hypothetical protein
MPNLQTPRCRFTIGRLVRSSRAVTTVARCVALAALWSCGARVVDLDGPPSDGGSPNPNSSPDAIARDVSIFIENQEMAMSIAVDEARVYWLSALPNGWSEDRGPVYARIRSCLKSGCPSSIVTYTSLTFDWKGTGFARGYDGLTVRGGNVYWAEFNPGTNLAIVSCPSTGCVGLPKVIASDVDLSSMTVDETHVYWTSRGDTAVLRLPLTGSGTPQAIALNEASPDRIVVSETHAYWIANAGQANAAIKRVPKQGGEPAVTLVAEQNQASSLAIDSGFFYWANSYSVGSISRCPLSGCVDGSSVLIADQTRPSALVADGSSIFWIAALEGYAQNQTRGAVQRCAVDACGTSLQTLALQIFAPGGMSTAVDPSDVYWVAQGPTEPSGIGFYPRATIYRHRK